MIYSQWDATLVLPIIKIKLFHKYQGKSYWTPTIYWTSFPFKFEVLRLVRQDKGSTTTLAHSGWISLQDQFRAVIWENLTCQNVNSIRTRFSPCYFLLYPDCLQQNLGHRSWTNKFNTGKTRPGVFKLRPADHMQPAENIYLVRWVFLPPLPVA